MRAQAFVLAAGFGTRLRPLTQHRPKPLVPVCGIPVLEQALGLCAQHGIQAAVVNAHHLAPAIERWCEAYEGMRVQVQVETPEILGTGGGLQAARPLLGDPFAVVNGDVLCDGDLGALLAACEQPGTDAAMLLRRADDAATHGIVALGPQGRVVRLTSLARLEGVQPVAEDTHFTGIHALRLAALDHVPAQGFSCIVRSAYVQLIPRGRVRGTVHPGTWLDVGNPAVYLEANRAVMDGRVPLPIDPWVRAGFGLRLVDGEPRPVGEPGHCDLADSAVLRSPCWLGRGAVVERGALLGPHVVVGEGARIGAGAQLSDTVVWDGCAVRPGARLQGCVVHDGGVLELPRP
jgi:mannose-1-phosphate guanylyltransferase